MKSITIFCGSSTGHNTKFMDKAYQLGKFLAENNIQIIYGGAKVGLMGAVANGALGQGGKVIGVLPYFLQSKEVAHPDLTELILVETMHERKLKMHELSEGIITLPGGFGTMEEFFEMLTWGQLGLHVKPIAIYNLEGYFDFLISLFDHMLESGFIHQHHKQLLLHSDRQGELLEKMKVYESPVKSKWLSKRTT
ncbi:TIGR00730 family Rossman fold protein [soil metagenome]